MALFSKYSGAGNDFVIVRGEEVGLRDATALARRICSRRWGVGVDGLILVRSLSEEFIRIRFFNPDGSEFGTCGNGTRCAARYSHDRGLTGPELMIHTDDGEVRARVAGSQVDLDYALDAKIEMRLELEVDGSPRPAWLVWMGTPHLVVEVEDVELDEFDEVCAPLRSHPEIGPEGANVDLVSVGDGELLIRTFERGVEGETLACGSGCMATAFAFADAGVIETPVELRTRSGTVLRVDILEEGLIRLGGPADHIFDGVLPDQPI
ncbi:MAG: diaminopimelate epimerase [Gemmatimonadota bacterium]|nr:diaminopimelate epimerase [Gemmatimonadota bacterium]